MNAIVNTIHEWPEIPPLPVEGDFALVRVPVSFKKQQARQELRGALREILVCWSGLEKDRILLRETPVGPVWPGLIHGAPLDVSLSYISGESWIALRRGGWVGVDAMRAVEFPEMDDLARQYSDSYLLDGDDRALSFALLWTGHEAKLKCAKTGIGTKPSLPCQLQTAILQPGTVVTVAMPLQTGF